jgi:hypothetical protein
LGTGIGENGVRALGGFGIWGVIVEHVTLLKQSERVRLDPDRLDELYLQLGQQQAEDVVCRALEELAARLTHVERFYRQGKTREMRKCARSLGAIAGQLGMDALARVARDVGGCSEAGDAVALAAVLARLLRVGEMSLTEIWDVPAY